MAFLLRLTQFKNSTTNINDVIVKGSSADYINANSVVTYTVNSGYTYNNTYNYRLRFTNSNIEKSFTPTIKTDTQIEFIVDSTIIASNTQNDVNVWLYAVPTQIISGVNIDYTLSNCNCTPSIQQLTDSNQIFSISLNTGYTFNTLPIFRFTDGNNEITSYNFYLDSTDNTYKFDCSEISNILTGKQIQIEASAILISVIPIYEINAGVILNDKPLTISYGDTITLSPTLENGYKDLSLSLYIDNIQTDFDVVVNTYSYTFNNISTDTTIKIISNAVEKTRIEYHISNCVFNPYIEYVDDLQNDTVITVQAVDGFILSALPIALLDDNTQTVRRISDTECQIVIFYSIKPTKAIFNANAIYANSKYGIVATFKVDSAILIAFSKKRFIIGLPSNAQYIDLAQYITALKLIYIDIPSSISTNIQLGYTDTQINAPYIDNDVYTFDLGTLKIQGLYNNGLDVLYSTISIQLPFINLVTLDSIYINHKINIVYDVNVISGKCQAYLYDVDDNNKTMIAVFDGVIGYDLPYLLDRNYISTQYNSNGISTNSILYNQKPSILIHEKTLSNNDNVFNTDKFDLISNEIGYFMIDYIDFNIVDNMTMIEYNTLMSTLQSGCYI